MKAGGGSQCILRNKDLKDDIFNIKKNYELNKIAELVPSNKQYQTLKAQKHQLNTYITNYGINAKPPFVSLRSKS